MASFGSEIIRKLESSLALPIVSFIYLIFSLFIWTLVPSLAGKPWVLTDPLCLSFPTVQYIAEDSGLIRGTTQSSWMNSPSRTLSGMSVTFISSAFGETTKWTGEQVVQVWCTYRPQKDPHICSQRTISLPCQLWYSQWDKEINNRQVEMNR